MRLWALAIAVALVASCGESDPNAGDSNAATGEVTVSLPPALPVATPESAEPAEPVPEPAPSVAAPEAAVKEQPKAPPPKAEAPKLQVEPAAEAAEPETEPADPAPVPDAPDELPEASPPIAAEGLAGYIRGAGFQCDRVTATSRAPGGGPYKFDCAAGGSYRGTMRRGRLYFRPWGDRR